MSKNRCTKVGYMSEATAKIRARQGYEPKWCIECNAWHAVPPVVKGKLIAASEEMRKARRNQPYCTYAQALAQTRRVAEIARRDKRDRSLDCVGGDSCKASTETIQP